MQSTPFPVDPVLVGAGVSVAARSLARAVGGWKRYRGDAREICKAVLDDCWNGRFLGGSAGHFRQFWVRDLAMCTPALVRMGRRDQVRASLTWALDAYERHGAVCTTVFADRYPRDVYDFAADSLPMLLYAIHESESHILIDRHRAFLAHEIERYVARVFDPGTGLARSHRYFSAPADCVRARSTTFAATMLALLERLLAGQSRLPDPLRGIDVAGRLIASRWTGRYFRHALDHDGPSGDANLFPFVFDVLGDRGAPLRAQAFATLESGGFTEPLPLRYFSRRDRDAELPVPRLFTPNYQGDTIWMQLGPLYIGQLREVDPPRARALRDRMASVIERDGNFLELYDRHLRPYTGRAGLYRADEGMIWAALFLDL